MPQDMVMPLVRPGVFRRWVVRLGALPLSAAASAQPPAPNVPVAAAPAAWVAYAGEVERQIQGWLTADSAPAQRLNAYFSGRPQDGPDRSTELLLKLWIDPDGTIARLDFAPFANSQAGADLAALIQGRRLDAPPPIRMLQPLRLKLTIKIRPETKVHA